MIILVSKDSWHYKMIERYLTEYPSSNICGYLGQVFRAFLSILVITAVLSLVVSLFFGLGVLVPYLAWILDGLNPFTLALVFLNQGYTDLLMFSTLHIVLLVILIICSINYLHSFVKDHVDNKKRGLINKMTEDERELYEHTGTIPKRLLGREGLFSLIKYKMKEKLCLHINFVDK